MTLPPTFPPTPSMRPAWVKECQFIEGDTTTPDAMCGAPLKPGSVYCWRHHGMCFTPHKRRVPERVPE